MTILKKDIFPFIGDRQIDEITSAELLIVLKRIDSTSSATTRKAYSSCKQVFSHAIPSGKIVISPAEGLHNHVAPRIVKHMAVSVNPDAVFGQSESLLRVVWFGAIARTLFSRSSFFLQIRDNMSAHILGINCGRIVLQSYFG